MTRAFGALVLVGAILAACGGGGPATPGPGVTGGPGTTTAPGGPAGSESDLEAAARALFEAFQDRDKDAYYAGLSLACRTSAGFGIVSERLNSRYGRIDRADIDLDAMTVLEVLITGFDGHSANVSLSLGGTGGNEFLEGQANAWVYEDGAWHWANCDPFEGGGGGGGDVGGSGPDDPIGVGFVPTIASWYVHTTYLNPNGNELVAGEGGPAPPAGAVFFLWSVSVTYNGPDASATLGDDMAFRLVAGSNTYDDPSDCGGYTLALDLTVVAPPGEGAIGDICRAIAPGDTSLLFMVVTEKSTGRDFWFGQQ